ncbi:hypothetical protein B0H14DRAFT_2574528 [Mycena olivaceomarginata]|nr:hypothetical protein B0H14DRAFT_2574528 [Mycena olivaceomarginata]
MLANAVVSNWSANVILEHCKLAVEGKYTAQNYTLYEIYLAIFIYELGGAGALYAMNHSIFALPSRNTIQPYRSQAKLMPSVNGVRVAEISSNISALFGPRASREPTETAKPTIYGHTLSFDEVATERKIDYMPQTDDMGGLLGTNTNTVEAAVAAVREGKVHISHETSVGAVSRLSETGYGSRPVFMGPSCKTGGRTLLRSKAGLLVKNTCINIDLLFSWLERLPDHDWSETSLHALLDPADEQNVWGAIKLNLCIIELTSLDKADFDPNEAVEFEALCLLAEFLNAWLQPYINTDLSLSEQIESLVLCSHLCAGIYIQNGASFMSNQLFSHVQASVKNAVLMVAKARVINGELKVFICFLGDDVLEALFGRSRMIGGHSPNCSVAELRDHFMSAMNFERQPRRLNMSRMRHVDHLRSRHFQRELRAGSCDLPVIWKSAVRKVEAILAKYGVRMGVSFAIRFKQPETDLLCPFGGKYPALSSKVDRSVVDSSSAPTTDSTVNPGSFNPSHLIPTAEFDRMFAEIESSDTPPRHSLFADIDDNGRQGHKKTIVRTFFDMTHDIHTSRDRLQRVRCFTTAAKPGRERLEKGTKPCLHRPTFSSCTLIKKGPTGSEASSVSAVPRAELDLPDSVYTISGQVISVVPLGRDEDSPVFAWDGNFVSFSQKKKGQSDGGEVSRIRNLQFAVTSRLIDSAIHEQAHEFLALDSEVACDREKTWSFSDKDLSAAWSCLWERLLADKTLHNKLPVFTGISDGVFPYATVPPPDSPAVYYSKPIAGTVVEETHFNRSTCRVCGIVVEDTNRHRHVGEHILKSICGVEDPSVKLLVRRQSRTRE